MSTCPNGHSSSTDDYCDTCGAPMAASASASGGAAPVTAPSTPSVTSATGAVVPEVSAGDCPNCGAAKVGGEKFCEVCGLDFESGALPAPPETSPAPPPATAPAGTAAPAPPGIGWTAVVTCDRDWWEHNAGAGGVADGVPFPDPEPAPRRIPLHATTVIVGRTSGSTVPDVDCGSADTGVSRRHLRLQLREDGGWTVTDLGSTNGTFLDVSETCLAPQAETGFGVDQRLKIGAYTVVSLETTSTTT